MKYKSEVFSNCILNKSFDSFKSRILDIKNKCVCKWQKGNQLILGQKKKSHNINEFKTNLFKAKFIFAIWIFNDKY